MRLELIFIVLLFFSLPLAHAQNGVLPTSYWGYVTEDGILEKNVSISVIDPAGHEIANTSSQMDGLYRIIVPRDDPATQADEGAADNETISFKVGGKIAVSRVIDEKGTNNRLDLNITTSRAVPPVSSGSGSSGWREESAPSNYAVTSAITVTAAPTPVQTNANPSRTETPNVTASMTVTAAPKETTANAAPAQTAVPASPVPAQTRNMPMPGVVVSIVIFVYLAVVRKN